MQWVQKFNTTDIVQTYLTWDITLSYDKPVDVRWKTEREFSSGIMMRFEFSRSPDFFTKVFIVPSIIFVVLAYITFWISQNHAPARVIFSITNILNAISLLVSTEKKVP
jgi:hypothetical protein